MSWFYLAIVAYFLNAVAMLADKFLLTKKVDNPAVYTFYVSVLSIVTLLIWPFDFVAPDGPSLAIGLAAGVSFTAALFFLYTALSRSDVSKIGPLIGGLMPIFAAVLAWWLLTDRLLGREWIGLLFLIFGSLAMSVATSRGFKLSLGPVMTASFLFALSAVLSKKLFLEIGFITGFVLMRLGAFVGAGLLLLRPVYYQAIKRSRELAAPQVGGLFVLGQSAGAIAAVLIGYAISLASVTLVSALQGLQYAFLFLLTILVSVFAPKILAENFKPRSLFFKILAIILIGAGLAFLI